MSTAVLHDSNLLRRPMRIAAGGTLTLSAVFGAVVAIGYVFGGPFAVQLAGFFDDGDGGFSMAGSEAIELLGGAAVIGHILLISASVVFLGAVSVFASLYPRVIFLACAVGIVSSLLGIWFTTFGLHYAVGIVAGGLGLISGLRIQLGMKEAARAGIAALPRGLADWLAVCSVVAGLAIVLISTYASFQ